MASTIITELAKRLQCAICLEIVDNPKNLNCNHSYCKQCLDKLLKFTHNGSASIKCPKGCKNTTKISHKQTTNDLGVNYMLKDILEMTNVKRDKENRRARNPMCENKENQHSGKVTCENKENRHVGKSSCETCAKDVKKYCYRCKVFKCERCPDMHDRIEDSIVPVDFHARQNKAILVCKEHSMEATYICCETKFVCVYCVHRSHKLHKYETLDEVEKTMKGVLIEKINSDKCLDVQRRELKKDMLYVKHDLEKTLKVKKMKCLSEYSEYLDEEEEKIKKEFHSLCKKHTTKSDSIPYFKKCLSKEGLHFALQRNEMMNKLQNLDKEKILPDVSVSLTDTYFNCEHPLGVLNVLEENVVSGKEGRKRFRSEMSTASVGPSSISSLKRLLVETFPEHMNSAEYGGGIKREQEELDNSSLAIEKAVEMKTIVDGCMVRLELRNVSLVKEAVYSDEVVIRNLPWRIQLIPRFCTNKSGEWTKCAGIFVECVPKGEGPFWSCKADVNISLKNHKGKNLTTKTATHLFCADENSLGYNSFVPWSNIIDTEKGYNKDDSIIIEATVKSGFPICNITTTNIPEPVMLKLLEERLLLADQMKRERREAHLYMDVQILTEDSFCTWSGSDLFDIQHVKPLHFKIEKKKKLYDATKIIADSFGYDACQCRLWPFFKRPNNTVRPSDVKVGTEDNTHEASDMDIELFDANMQKPVMLVFLETLNVVSELDRLPDFDSKNEIILFFKFYNPAAKIMSYCGHSYIDLKTQPTSLFPMLCQRAGLPKGTKLLFYVEVDCGQITKIETHDQFLNLIDGDIICFQADEGDIEEYDVPSPIEYFQDIMQRVDVTFCDRNDPSDLGFIETLHLEMKYTEMAEIVCNSLSVVLGEIQFFKSYGDEPGDLIVNMFCGQLKEIISGEIQRTEMIYYQIL